jgi:hypothetical protein
MAQFRQRKYMGFTVDPEVDEMVRNLSKATDVPMSRIVERAIRDRFKNLTADERAALERVGAKSPAT